MTLNLILNYPKFNTMETASTANDLMNYKAREARETKNPNLRLKNLDNLREKASDAFLYCGLKV